VAALEAAVVLADAARVDDLLALIEGLPPGDLTPQLRAIGARFGAWRDVMRGDQSTADAGFRASARIYREIERRFDVALVVLEHSEWLVGAGQTEEAEPLAAEAREIFERLRATPYLERLDRLPVEATAPAG
jgi:hypothetical protein